MQTPIFAPGFRLSFVDVVVLVLGAICTLVLGSLTWWWGFVVGFGVGHFFLFCNVFRIARNLELVWAGIFLALAGTTIATETPGWVVTTVASLTVTVAVVVCEMRKPSYHGIFWNRVNPKLPNWWKSHVETLTLQPEINPQLPA